ncbi:MAG: hypothetical protein PHN61_01470, partial [Methanothrix sp.]|nr:hypothetical protein [Methanothrix sp.]
KKLAALKLDITQICVITPLPQTPMWTEIVEKFGIWDQDYHHYDGKHMVWNHPQIKPEEFPKILDWSFKQVHPWYTPFRTSSRVWGNAYRYGGWEGVKEVAAYISRANKFDWNAGLRLLDVDESGREQSRSEQKRSGRA